MPSQKEYVATLGRCYYSRARNPMMAFDTSGSHKNLFHKKILYLSTCSREGCDKSETEEIRFSRCSVCFTKYCSRECQLLDHKDGEHKTKCKLFKLAKEVVEKTLCTKCWDSKWNEVSQKDPSTIFMPCNRCLSTPPKVDKDTLNTLLDDPDIYTVWFM